MKLSFEEFSEIAGNSEGVANRIVIDCHFGIISLINGNNTGHFKWSKNGCKCIGII